ncbi:fumarylacetoacetase [Paucibacter oligotrophus]|uniref:fumarylacetoacetase n=1 Tax=Roseateles oligotrophus TaxID=1769250 RepID=A0A840L6F3_9BURK|nr:fumarylacetoacetase [Roseateles oligotrophus]MBB4842195.1 fumarylacetoacetase [Roseateles oligotrophus]
MIDHTHNPAALSWVASANEEGSEFPLQNLPYGLFRRAGSNENARVGIAIGDQILDTKIAAAAGKWSSAVSVLLQPLADGDLNAFMAQPAAQRRLLRHALFEALSAGSPQEAALRAALLPQAQAQMAVPCRIGDYTDFYTGIHHATTVGKLFRPDNPLLPNYKWVPIGYHGRSSSIGVSGGTVRRPLGQLKSPDAEVPGFSACKRLDYELELGAFVAAGNALGEPIPMAQADEHLFGLTLLNDWSARDVQAWEYQPLGPFLAKNFGSTISPWIVSMEALEPFRIAFEHPASDPQPLPYLDSAKNRAEGGYDIELEVWLQTESMRAKGEPATRLMRSNFRHAYWTLAQMLTHHASNGCNLQPGDLLGTGTLSGPDAAEGGSLLELSMGGKQDLRLPNGETRKFLQDGDTVILRGYAQREGARRIGFGDCSATIVAAPALS